jgi:hypothetical protein
MTSDFMESIRVEPSARLTESVPESWTMVPLAKTVPATRQASAARK